MSDSTSPIEPHQTQGLVDHYAGAVAHPVPWLTLLVVFLILLGLTAATVGVTYFDFGSLNIWVALLIAVAKAGLVAMYFMHLRWDSPFNGIILITALLFVAIFIGIAVLDSKEYQVNFEPPAGLVPEQP